jgi:hypothetical protein
VVAMTGLIILLAALAAIVVFDLLAQTHGVDSRPDFEDPRAPVRGLTT